MGTRRGDLTITALLMLPRHSLPASLAAPAVVDEDEELSRALVVGLAAIGSAPSTARQQDATGSTPAEGAAEGPVPMAEDKGKAPTAPPKPAAPAVPGKCSALHSIRCCVVKGGAAVVYLLRPQVLCQQLLCTSYCRAVLCCVLSCCPCVQASYLAVTIAFPSPPLQAPPTWWRAPCRLWCACPPASSPWPTCC